MRLLQGIVLGIVITIGAAFLHDNVVPHNPSAPLLENQQLVNWDALGRLTHDMVAQDQQLWNRAFGR